MREQDFEAKKQILGKTNLFLDEKIKGAEVWDEQQIDARTEWLANKAFHTVFKI